MATWCTLLAAMRFKVVRRGANMDTKLTAWFKLNQSSVLRRHKLDAEIPEYYTWNNQHRRWERRRRGRAAKTVGRIYYVGARQNPEKYYLRVLLLRERGATGWDDLKRVVRF